MRRAIGILAAAIAPAAATAQGAEIGARIEAVRDGTVRLSYAVRSGVCGDGRDVVRLGRSTWVLPSIVNYGDSHLQRCDLGPARLEVERSGGETTRIRIHVGGSAAGDGGTELGAVSAPAAARYFVAVAPRLGKRAGEAALLAAMIADSAAIAPELDRLARSADAPDDLRGHAIFGLASLDEADADARLRALVGDAGVPEKHRGEAIIAMSGGGASREDAAYLRKLYPTFDDDLRQKVFLTLSRADDPAAVRWVAEQALDASQPLEVRRQALFWSGQGSLPTSDLVALYARLGDRALREHFTFVLSQRHDSLALDQLMTMARSDGDRGTRRQALFWLGQSHDPRAKAFLRDLVLQ